MGVCHITHGRNIQDIQTRIAQGFTEEQFGVGLNCGCESVWIPRINKSRLNTKARQGVVQQVVGTAINGSR